MNVGHYGFAFFIFVLACLLMVLYNYLFSDMKRQKKLLDEKENKLLRLYQSVEEALDDFHDSVERSHGEISAQLEELGELHAEVERNMRGLAAHAPSRIERHESPMARRPAAVPPSAQRAAAAVPPPRTPAPQMTRPPVMQSAQPAPAPAAQPEPESAPPSFAESISQATASIRAAAPTPSAGVPSPSAVPPPASRAPQTMAPPPVFRQVIETVEQMEPEPMLQGMGRNEQILAMSQEGKTRSQIAKELGITLSEVDLVIGMNK